MKGFKSELGQVYENVVKIIIETININGNKLPQKFTLTVGETISAANQHFILTYIVIRRVYNFSKEI